MENIVYYILWRLCLFLIEIGQSLHRLLIHIKYFYRKSYDLFSGRSYNEVKYLEGCRKEWQTQKIPRHLLVVVGRDEQLSSKVLSNLAVYALLSNIECISFYDTRNRYEPAKHIPKFIESRQLRNGLFLWTMVGDKSGCLKYKNGMERSIEVSVLTEHDSKPLLAEVCNDLQEAYGNAEIQEALKDPTKAKLTEIIDHSVRKKLHNLPNPELVIVFNDYLCTFGALPWSTSFAEFHNISKGNYTTVHDFTDIMYKFAKCQQRFGK